jgi:hypothetical protein
MTVEDPSDLERRIRRAEAQVAAARQEIQELLGRQRRAGGTVASFAAGVVFAMVGGYMATTVGAQMGGRSVVAPFYVTDAAGKPVFTVRSISGPINADEKKAEQKGELFKGAPGPQSSAGMIQIFDNTSSASSFFKTNTWAMQGPGDVTKLYLGYPASDSSEAGLYFSGTSKPAAFIGRSNNRGVIELNDANGAKMVEAGSTNAGKGFVLVTPYQASGRDPSVLMGGLKGK